MPPLETTSPTHTMRPQIPHPTPSRCHCGTHSGQWHRRPPHWKMTGVCACIRSRAQLADPREGVYPLSSPKRVARPEKSRLAPNTSRKTVRCSMSPTNLSTNSSGWSRHGKRSCQFATRPKQRRPSPWPHRQLKRLRSLDDRSPRRRSSADGARRHLHRTRNCRRMSGLTLARSPLSARYAANTYHNQVT